MTRLCVNSKHERRMGGTPLGSRCLQLASLPPKTKNFFFCPPVNLPVDAGLRPPFAAPFSASLLVQLCHPRSLVHRRQDRNFRKRISRKTDQFYMGKEQLHCSIIRRNINIRDRKKPHYIVTLLMHDLIQYFLIYRNEIRL